MEYDHSKIKDAFMYWKMPPGEATPEALAKVRGAILERVAQLGIDVAGAPPAPAGGETSALIFWESDEDMALYAYVVPDGQITPAQRAALAAAPYCFAEPGDCEPGGWWAAVRLMGALGVDDLEADGFFYVFVTEKVDEEDEPPPSADEITASYRGWSSFRAANVFGDDLSWLANRFSSVYAFNRAM